MDFKRERIRNKGSNILFDFPKVLKCSDVYKRIGCQFVRSHDVEDEVLGRHHAW